MDRIETRLKELGLELPAPPKPLALYVPARRVGDLITTSGQVAVKDGEFLHIGRVGAEVTLEQGRECARLCALNCLAAVKGVLGSLDDVAEVVELRGFVNSAPDFFGQPEVIDAASELMLELFGEDGRHARSAVGASPLPRNVPVELEMVVRLAGT